MVRKLDADNQFQFARSGEHSHKKGGQPPGLFGKAGQRFPVFKKLKGNREHIFIIHGLE